MSQNDPPFFMPRFDPVPRKFYPEKSEKPFDKCIMCEKFLLSDGTQYMIEKAFRRYPALGTEAVVFEYAICKDARKLCARSFRKNRSRK